jgi:hypothetical protein
LPGESWGLNFQSAQASDRMISPEEPFGGEYFTRVIDIGRGRVIGRRLSGSRAKVDSAHQNVGDTQCCTTEKCVVRCSETSIARSRRRCHHAVGRFAGESSEVTSKFVSLEDDFP